MVKVINLGQKSSKTRISINRNIQPKGHIMHGIKEIINFNARNAEAAAIMAKTDVDGEYKKTQAVLEAYLVEKAKNVTSK